MPPQRVVIVGKPGAGKSTLAAQLSTKLNLQNIELDGIFWQPDWTPLPKPEFHLRVDILCPADGPWVADGNYKILRDIIWDRADTLIWLDYPLHLALWRCFKRTFSRIFRGVELWNGNKESLGHMMTLNTDENLFLWLVKVHFQHRREWPGLLTREEYKHLNVLRFRNPKETEQWLGGLPDSKDL